MNTNITQLQSNSDIIIG